MGPDRRRLVSWVLALACAFCWAHPSRAASRARVLRKTMVPMRDGVRLATDVYLPNGDGPAPAVLARSVYGRGNESFARPFTSQGIAFVVQDTRGRGDSEGTDRVFEDDGWGTRRDGADTVDWMHAQPWCNGKVGTWGASALGITQVLLAAATPRLTCQSIQVAPSTLYGQMTYRGGVWHKAQCEHWLRAQGNAHIIELWTSHPRYDTFWAGMDAELRAAQVTAPAIHVGGWWDMFTQGTLDNYTSRQERGAPPAKGDQLLVIGPWAHGGTLGPRKLGDLQLSKNYRFDVAGLESRFYRHWLKGEATGIADESRVHYYVLGDAADKTAPGNEWRTADAWPPFATTRSCFYLAEDGRLAPGMPAGAAGSVSFTYDPADPCPTHGGANYNLPAGPFDQRKVSSRADVLRFETPPLAAPLEISGRVVVELHVSSDAIDTDFTAKLVDVYPDGREILMLDGIQRVKYRDGCEAADLLPPGTVAAVEIDLWSIALVVNRGHRVGLHLSSSNYPRFDKNPNSGDDFPTADNLRVARNTVYFGKPRPSALVLPVRADPRPDTAR